MASRLYNTIIQETRLNVSNTIFMTDSMIVLGWIRSNSRSFKHFVSHRISKIYSNSDPDCWRYVPGELNVADDLSHGIDARQLNGRGRVGPDFLYIDESEWPAEISIAGRQFEGEYEMLHQSSVMTVLYQKLAIDCNRFSSWTRLLRVTAYVGRYMLNLKAKVEGKNLTSGSLTPDEHIEAE